MGGGGAQHWKVVRGRSVIKIPFFTADHFPGGGGTWKGLWGCPAVKTPFLRSLHFNQKPQNFLIICSKCLNLVNFQFLRIKKLAKNLVQEASFGPKISSASSILVKKSVQQAPKFGADLFYKPPTKMKVEYPPPPDFFAPEIHLFKPFSNYRAHTSNFLKIILSPISSKFC